MRAPKRPAKMPALIPLLWLGGCASAPPPIAPPLAAIRAEATTPAARRAEIVRQIAPVCPAPMTPGELDALATRLEASPNDAGLRATAARLDRSDREARACRGL